MLSGNPCGTRESGRSKERKRRSIELTAVYDIETEGFDKFLVGGLRNAAGEYEDFDHGSEGSLAGELAAVDGTVWAHNGGNFDHKWFLSRSRASGVQATVRAAGGRMVSVQQGRLNLLDSKALTKISLKDLTCGLRVQKMEQPLPCQTPEVCGVWCQGYCRFKRGMPRRDLAKVREYLRADCESLWEALEALATYAEREDLDLTGTVGGSSWANARRLLDLPDAMLSISDHVFARKAYYGGRVQVFRPFSRKGFEYDVNSLYPAALARMSLPCGAPARRHGLEASAAYLSGCDGVYRVAVRVPSMWIPPLPTRTRKRSAYPTGRFRGVYCGNELRYAESQGVMVEEVFEALVYPESKNVFKPWIEKLWALRANAPGGKSGPWGTFLKFYMNSLTGKLGMRPESQTYVVNPRTLPKGASMLSEGVYSYPGPVVRKRHGRWVAGSPCCHVLWAGYLTAWGRIQWHRWATEGGGQDLCMGDTDSIFSEEPRYREVGDGLGQLQRNGTYRDLRVTAPKFYDYVPEKVKETLRCPF